MNTPTKELDEGPSKEDLEEETKDTITELDKPKPSFLKKSLSIDIDEVNEDYD
jgi:hypothetical protein